MLLVIVLHSNASNSLTIEQAVTKVLQIGRCNSTNAKIVRCFYVQSAKRWQYAQCPRSTAHEIRWWWVGIEKSKL